MDRMNELITLLNKYAYQYYVLDEPTVADKEYDVLYDELVALEKTSGTVLDNSPTRRVGGEVLSGFSKYEHRHKLYSLDKAQSYGEVTAFIDRVQKEVGNAEYSVEYKFDGLTMNLTYENGKFVRATTRGTGEVGEDVTQQVLTIKTFPLEIDYKGELEVVGEAIMYLSTLEKYNATYDVPLKNARNAVAGAIRNLDPKETAKRQPQIVFYSINYIEDYGIVNSQREVIEFLKANKFKISPYFAIANNGDDVIKHIEEIGKKRPDLDFLIDGVVLKVNAYDSREQLGFTEKFPKWAIAYKFEAEEITTVLQDVIWQVGRTGKLTPLAILEPKELCGVTVSRATLNNYGDIERKQVSIGDRVFIRRSNDVIPEVLGRAESSPTSKKIEKIQYCPDCGTAVVEKGAHIFCPNELSCKSQIIARITHYASKNAVDIVGFSEKTAQLLLDKLEIKFAYQLYSVTKEQLLTLDGFKEKKADKFIASIEKSKHIDFDKFIYALGILNVGTKTAKDLAKTFADIEELKKATAESLVAIEDIGDIVASSIVDYFNDEIYMENLAKLLEIVTVNYASKQPTSGVFSGETVVLTGSMQKYSRSEAGKIIESMGGTIGSSVTKKTTLVVYGEEAGSKLVKATKLGIKLLDEEQFLNIIESVN